jgi:hypothetical protein
LDSIAKERVEGMGSGIKAAIRTNEGTSADSDQTGIEKGAVEVDIDALTEPGDYEYRGMLVLGTLLAYLMFIP